MKHKVILVDDHKIIRDGLRSLLENEGDFEVVAEAKNGRKALQMIRKHSPDLVIMDISMPDLNGIDATRLITSELPEVRVIALSMHRDPQFLEGMLEAGAFGYLLKECAYDELIDAVRTVILGKIYLSPDITGQLVDRLMSRKRQIRGETVKTLSTREREVLQLIAEGRATKDIAARLNISVKTVETHRKHIMEKLGRYTVAELTKCAVRIGLTELDT